MSNKLPVYTTMFSFGNKVNYLVSEFTDSVTTPNSLINCTYSIEAIETEYGDIIVLKIEPDGSDTSLTSPKYMVLEAAGGMTEDIINNAIEKLS